MFSAEAEWQISLKGDLCREMYRVLFNQSYF